MTNERIAFFIALILCVTLVSTVTTVKVIESARLAEISAKQKAN